MRVTEDGEIHYVFRELTDGTGPRVRVALAEGPPVEEEADVEPREERVTKN
jgi:hypothetical protein